VKRLLTIPNGLFVVLALVQLLPGRNTRVPDSPAHAIALACVLEAVLLVVTYRFKGVKRRAAFNVCSDVIGFLFGFLIFWTLAAAKLPSAAGSKGAVFPPPGAVIRALVSDVPATLKNIVDSLGLIFQGYLLALAVAIPLGLLLGWHARAGAAASYISKFLSSISPIVYIPYAIVLLPTFRAASVFVIFVASFWPALAGTMSGVLNVERRILDSARSLGARQTTMLFRIVLPASLPQIFIGCNQGLSVSFVLLTSAEMIGARSGMGYNVNNFANFGNYTRVLAGVLVIGIVVTAITFCFNRLQGFLLRWRQ
jgi:NitT/TauT family transport system permease protein